MLKHSSVFCVLFILSACVVTSKCAKILGVFPTPSISHQVVFRELTLELVRRGHEMVVITTDPAFKDTDRPANLIELDMHNVYGIFQDFMASVRGKTSNEILMPMVDAMIKYAEEQFNTTEIQELLKSDQHFDLVISEAVMPTGLGFAYKFKAPVIEMSSFYANDMNYIAMGAPTHPFLYPPVNRHDFTNLTLTDKLNCLVDQFPLAVGYIGMLDKMHSLMKTHFGEDIPAIPELQQTVDMLFVNSFSIWDFNRPVPMNVVFLGALHVREPKRLPKDLKKLLDSSKHGFIYMSFGSNVDPTRFPEETIRIFLNVFSKLPYDVIWKWNEGDLPGKPSNVYTFKWLPQNDLLYHPKIKLFITQGGMQSTDEAIIAGVPMLGIPIFGDQPFNTAKYEYYQIGKRLELDTLKEEELIENINSIIDNKIYKQNIVKLRELMRDTPQTALQRAVWWTEYVIRHKGAQHLKPATAHVSYAEYFELELIAALLGILVAALSSALLVLYVSVRCIVKLIKKKQVKLKST